MSNHYEHREIIFVDEVFFWGQDRLATAWSTKRNNIVVPERPRDQQKIGVMGGFSLWDG